MSNKKEAPCGNGTNASVILTNHWEINGEYVDLYQDKEIVGKFPLDYVVGEWVLRSPRTMFVDKLSDFPLED